MYPFFLCDDAVRKLDGGAVEEHEVYGVGPQHGSNLRGQPCPIGRGILEFVS